MGKTERPFTVAQIAAMMGLSPRIVTRLFEHEKGVLIYEAPNLRRKRKHYRTLRVPRHVYERVRQRYTVR
jgi:transcriptional regulator GlxA family with amidase domain